jgi:hypothetical protein
MNGPWPPPRLADWSPWPPPRLADWSPWPTRYLTPEQWEIASYRLAEWRRTGKPPHVIQPWLMGRPPA